MFRIKIYSDLGMRLYHAARARRISGTLLANELLKKGLDRLDEQQDKNPTFNICCQPEERDRKEINQ